MQTLQEHRDHGEGREQDGGPSSPQPASPAGMAGQQQFPVTPYQWRPLVVVQNYYQAPPVATPVVVAARSSGPSSLARALWFIFVGWWLGPVGAVRLRALPWS